MDQSSLFKIENFKAGFVSVIGLPNVGKSTLINALIGQKLSIVSPKPQTTRDHIKAILNGENFQIIFIDTPGFIRPFNILEKNMMSVVLKAVKDDADIVCLVVDPEVYPKNSDFLDMLKKLSTPLLLVINKIDINEKDKIEKTEKFWKENLPNIKDVFKVSAKNGVNVTSLKQALIDLLPNSPPYYETGILSDRWERFFVSEIIRENIFNMYKDEVPYSCAVEIESFKETENSADIRAIIYVSKENHKPILIGKNGIRIATLRDKSRKEIERFINKMTNLELYVKVKEKWQNDINFLKKYYNY